MENLAYKLEDTAQEASSLKIAHKNLSIANRLKNKQCNLAVVGLGYVGLPIALEFAKNYKVIGFDIKSDRIDLLNSDVDPSGELEASEFLNKDIHFTHQLKRLEDAAFYVVAVPTPINRLKQPDLTPLKKATASVGNVLKKGDFVVFESTVYPLCTEEICIPILERISGLKVNKDFKVGYSPERINPGDKENTLTSIKKIVSGHDYDSLDQIAEVYESIITAGVHRAPSMKIAEAAKIVENTQRDVNIALMNELSVIFEKLNINTNEVLEAAGTKWNFLNFFPGLVGGHCIGVDPYYLIHKSKEMGYTPTLISSGRAVNDYMPTDLANRIKNGVDKMGLTHRPQRILFKGITFKENVSDIRNSKAAELVQKLQQFGELEVHVQDPYADPLEVKKEYGIELTDAKGTYDAIVIAVMHKEYESIDHGFLHKFGREHTLLFDIRGNLKDQIPPLYYRSL